MITNDSILEEAYSVCGVCDGEKEVIEESLSMFDLMREYPRVHSTLGNLGSTLTNLKNDRQYTDDEKELVKEFLMRYIEEVL